MSVQEGTRQKNYKGLGETLGDDASVLCKDDCISVYIWQNLPNLYVLSICNISYVN